MKVLTRRILLGIFVLVLSTGFVEVYAQEPATGTNGANSEDYELNPELSGGMHAPYASKQMAPLTVEGKDNQAKIKVETNGQLKPYLGAGKEKQPSSDVIPLMSKEDLEYYDKSYNLETGVGLNLKEKVDVNLGYRVRSQMSLMDGAQEEKGSGQIRFGVHFNY